MSALTVGSLCSGIGGLDLGLERAGMHVIWQAETDPYASRVLAKHWPNVPNHGDITTVDWSTVERPDLICAGYPCQPFSHAGRRLGAADERHLWPAVADAVRVLGPRWVVLENVTGHLGLGFDRVLADLAGLGFDAEWSVVSACSVGASHVRRRLFCVAHAHGDGEPALTFDGEVAWPASPPGGAGRWGAPSPDDVGADDGVPHRVDRCSALGNAVVPQVAEYVGRLITADMQRAS